MAPRASDKRGSTGAPAATNAPPWQLGEGFSMSNSQPELRKSLLHGGWCGVRCLPHRCRGTGKLGDRPVSRHFRPLLFHANPQVVWLGAVLLAKIWVRNAFRRLLSRRPQIPCNPRNHLPCRSQDSSLIWHTIFGLWDIAARGVVPVYGALRLSRCCALIRPFIFGRRLRSSRCPLWSQVRR